jgi:hypothetical protein
MVGRSLTCAAVLICAYAVTSSSARAEPRAVLELFTSQGCSSCPAADKLVGQFASDPSLLVMSLAIDYWDYLGWKDTLALAGHSRRQKAYAKSRHDREVYTPQIVVNGIAHVLGSDKEAIERAIEKTRKTAGVLSVPVTLAMANGKLNVKVPAGNDEHAEVWLCPMTKAISVAIGRGENHGRTITYHNVVRRWVKLGDWTGGKSGSWNVPLSDFATKDIDKVAVLVQRGAATSPGLVLGAAMTGLK